MAEFLVQIEIALPPGMDDQERRSLLEAEEAAGRRLVERGAIATIWRVPGRHANVGIWDAADATELHALISTLPLYAWMDVRVTALARHHLMD